MQAACLSRTATELTAAASGSSSPTTAETPSIQRTRSCTLGARCSAWPTVAMQMQLVERGAPLPARPRCVPVQQCGTRLIGLVLAAAQGDRLRLHHRLRIRQLRTQSRPVYSLSKITISEVSEVQRSMQQSNNLYTLIPDINSRPTLGNLSPTGRMSRNHLHVLATLCFNNFLQNFQLTFHSPTALPYVSDISDLFCDLYSRIIMSLAQFNNHLIELCELN